LEKTPADKRPYLSVIPGDTDKRNHYAMKRDAASSLV
jgi:hypothetical protein